MKTICPECGRMLKLTKIGRVRVHRFDGRECSGSRGPDSDALSLTEERFGDLASLERERTRR